MASRIGPDGSWVRYHYDSAGRLSSQERSHQDIGAGAGAGSAHQTVYNYSPVDSRDTDERADQYRPRTVTERIGNTTVALRYHAYIKDGQGERIEISERCPGPGAAYGAPGNLRTTHTYYGPETVGKGRIRQSRQPDGQLVSYSYARGTINGTDFVPGAGDAERIIATEGTVEAPDGIAHQSTRQTSLSDAVGNTVYQEAQVYTGSGYATIGWTRNRYDVLGRLVQTLHSDGTVTSAVWDCCGKASETDADGIETSYTYDALNRLATATRHPVNGAVTTSYTYDAAGRRTSQSTTGGAITLGTSTHYDAAGRIDHTIDSAGRTTAYQYPDPLTTTVVRPGNITETTTRYIDGRTKSVTGTGVVARYYTYGVNPDGTQWTRINTGSADSAMWQRTTSDLLGRTSTTEQPGYSGIESTRHHYDEKGRLTRTSSPGQADTLYVYDALGHQIRSGLDIDGNGRLDIASADRISDSDTRYVQIEAHWWQQSSQSVYATENEDEPTVVAIERQRRTGLGDGLVAQSVSIDTFGNRTVSTTTLNAAAQTRTQTIDYPDSTIDGASVTVGGLLISNTRKSGVTTTFGYDVIGRRITTTDPRTDTATTHYDALGQVDWIEDGAGHRTTFAYDPATGRKTSQTDANLKVTRFAYNDMGQVTHTWGDVPYPVAYGYDNLGRMHTMTTYRSDADFATEAFPADAAGDTTTWHYHPASGLLESKEYADTTAVGYTYTTAGRLKTRAWARQDNGQPLVTTYSYHPATGELTLIDYSDATADISFTYDRLGRQKKITDAAGSRSFGYNDQLQPVTETITGHYDHTITRHYETSGVAGRVNGFTLDADHTVTYGYQGVTGRLETLTWHVAGQTDTTTYSYVPDSDLIGQIATTGGATTIYGYEPRRNLKTRVQNNFNTRLVSQYDYRYDEIGRRSAVANTGTAFDQPAHSAYDYNDRSELTGAQRYLGTELTDTSNPVPDEHRGYQYDPIGNRLKATAGTITTDYDPANPVNQYTAIATGADVYTPAYDADGNLQTAPDGQVYTYNAENRLVMAAPQTPTDGDTRTEFVYDYMGRRVQKTVYTYSAGAWMPETQIHFVYDGWNMIRQTTIAAANEPVDAHYIWGLDLSQTLQGAGGVGGLLAAVTGSLTHHYLYDANGNVTQMIETGTGALAAHYEYDPFGNTVRSEGVLADENVYRFSTKYYDTEINLYYYGHRYYSPGLGRWINRDPIEELGNMVTQMDIHPSDQDRKNSYFLLSNNPINFIDLLGLKTTYTVNTIGVHILVAGISLGSAHAVTDCVDGIYYEAEYRVFSGSLGVGLDLKLNKLLKWLSKNSKTLFIGTTFTLESNYPKEYVTYLDIEGHGASFLYGGTFIDAEFSTYKGGRTDIKLGSHGWTGEIGLQIFQFAGITLKRKGKPAPMCCTESLP